MKKLFFVALISLVSIQVVSAWGGLGHQTVIAVAQRHLTEKTKANIAKYFSYDLKQDAVWMDTYRRTEPIQFTTNWHTCYFDENMRYDPFYLRKMETGDLVRALELAHDALSNGRYKNLSDEAVVFAVRILIHFVGDIHCPTHTVLPSAKNKELCMLNGKEYTYHSVYDKMPNFIWGKTPADEVAAKIDNASKKERKAIVKGDAIDWLNTMVHDNAKIHEWNAPGVKVMRDDTVELSTELVNKQMRDGGYRLAHLLNMYFGK